MDDNELRWSPPATRQLDPLAFTSPRVISAVIEFRFGRLIPNPHRVGRQLDRELAGWHSARVGQYRVIHWIDEADRTVYVDRIDHRSDVFRQR